MDNFLSIKGYGFLSSWSTHVIWSIGQKYRERKHFNAFPSPEWKKTDVPSLALKAWRAPGLLPNLN